MVDVRKKKLSYNDFYYIKNCLSIIFFVALHCDFHEMYFVFILCVSIWKT